METTKDTKLTKILVSLVSSVVNLRGVLPPMLLL
jgi:hypothetical protein